MKFKYKKFGQKGLFDIFIVKFDLIKEEVEIIERRTNKTKRG